MPRGKPDPWANCLLKHYVRTRAWLPASTYRRSIVEKAKPRNFRHRPLRYFTFCASGAKDVYMLDMEDVLQLGASRNNDEPFSGVYFFDLDELNTAEIQSHLPGAIGFPARFESVMLDEDPNEELILGNDEDAKEAITRDEENTREQRQREKLRTIRREFLLSFPFDVMNIDICGYVYKNKDYFPGKIINSLRKVFRLQKNEVIYKNLSYGYLNGFTLMFTSTLGPEDLKPEYINELAACLDSNISRSDNLKSKFENRTGGRNVNTLLSDDFDTFFMLSLPKIIAGELRKHDWHVDPVSGIDVFDFDRPKDSDGGTYKMLHFVMQVKRNSPIESKRGLIEPPEFQDAYDTVVSQLFDRPQVTLNDAYISSIRNDLQDHLNKVKERAAFHGYVEPKVDAEDSV
jgi:hypothetical protein